MTIDELPEGFLEECGWGDCGAPFIMDSITVDEDGTKLWGFRISCNCGSQCHAGAEASWVEVPHRFDGPAEVWPDGEVFYIEFAGVQYPAR